MASGTIKKSHVKPLLTSTITISNGGTITVEDISKYDMLDFAVYFSAANTVSSISFPTQRLMLDTTSRFTLERSYVPSQSQTVYLIFTRVSNTTFSFETNGTFYIQNIYGIKF